jgi:hypothetical protein
MGTIREIRAEKRSPAGQPRRSKQQSDEGLTAAEQALMPLLDRVIQEYEDGAYERDHALVDKLFDVLNHATYPGPDPENTYTMHIAWAASSLARAAILSHREACVEVEQRPGGGNETRRAWEVSLARRQASQHPLPARDAMRSTAL